jgi:NAD(P)-dependent dehydrogenase (short-subunit alcohol dehydrogenase family)
MALEYAPMKVRVNAIAPSATLTERVRKLISQNTALEKLAASHLLGLGQPNHIADMAVYLASDESPLRPDKSCPSAVASQSIEQSRATSHRSVYARA